MLGNSECIVGMTLSEIVFCRKNATLVWRSPRICVTNRDRPWQHVKMLLKSWALSENTVTHCDKSNECVPNLSEFTGNQSNKWMLEMHAKFTLGQQIARADGLRACVPKCVQIIHTLDPQGMNRPSVVINFWLLPWNRVSEMFVATAAKMCKHQGWQSEAVAPCIVTAWQTHTGAKRNSQIFLAFGTKFWRSQAQRLTTGCIDVYLKERECRMKNRISLRIHDYK